MGKDKSKIGLIFKDEQQIKIFVPVLLVASVAVVYFASLFNGFVYDDTYTIVQNPFIKKINSIGILFNPSEYFYKSSEESYRPVATLSYIIFYQLWKANPFLFHLSSVLLHALNVLLVYLIAYNLTKKTYNAAVAGLVFAAFPAFSEAVFCVSYNEDILACLFMLLAVHPCFSF